ncbi:MAG: tRNA lysidine(34) synthetase TilS, partial [Nitriliruptoraceae bacterium]
MDAPVLLAGDASFDVLIRHVADTLDDLPQGGCVVVGCSGGRDSVGLLHLVAAARGDLSLVAVYVDHGLNDTRADRDVVAGHAGTLGAVFRCRNVTVDTAGLGLEAAARDARYDALNAVAKDVSAAAVLVAHTADDLAETVWMRLLRGTGPDGLAAMRQRDGLLHRPLLSVRRITVHRFVAAHGLETVDDPMNSDRRFMRAQVRHDLFPVFQDVASDPVGAAWRLARLAGDDQTFMAALIDDHVPLVTFGDVAVMVPSEVLDGFAVALQRRVIRRMLHLVRPPIGRTSRHSDFAVVARVLDAPTCARFTVAGELEVARDKRMVCVARVGRPDAVPLVLGKTQPIPFFAAQLATNRADGERFVPPPFGNPGRFTATLRTGGSLTVRGFRDGDTVHTRRRDRAVKTLFGAAHMPVVLRRHWPLLCDGERIVWVPGFVADDAALV